MKKGLFVLFVCFGVLKAGMTFIIGNPILAKDVSPIVEYSIYKGYSRQVWDLKIRVEEKIDDLIIKYIGRNDLVSDNPLYQMYINADKESNEELKTFIKEINSQNIQAADVSFKTLSLSKPIDSKNINLNLSKSELKKINKETIKKGNYNGKFKTILFHIKHYYRCKDKICMAFYKTKPLLNGKYEITKARLKKPDIFFYEYFIPKRKGRRYFLNIIIYVASVDSDGEPAFEYEIIKDFNWERNFRFIAAQTGETIREIIGKKIGEDIR